MTPTSSPRRSSSCWIPACCPSSRASRQSTDADVRKNLAVAYGHLGNLADTETVTQLMCDKVWWVRYRAGQALLKLKGMTAERLEAVRAHLTDSYARDMLEHVRGRGGDPMILRHFITAVQWGFLGYFILLNAIYLGFAFIAVWRLRGYMGGRSAAERVYSHLQMPISLVVPAYNEAATITTSIKALLQLRYQHFEIIVVNDGSKDDTLATMIRDFELTPFPEAYRVQIKTKPVRGCTGRSSIRTCA